MLRRAVRVPLHWQAPASARPVRQRGQSQRTTKSELEELLYLSLTAAGLHHGCVREHLYVPGRRYRADMAWPEHRLLVEVQGGIWSPKSGHSGGSGITKDIERGNAATLAGWRVLRFGPQHIRSGEAVRISSSSASCACCAPRSGTGEAR